MATKAGDFVEEAYAARRFTVEEYHRMAEIGIFKPDERVELIRGVVRRMSPKSDSHSIAVAKVVKLFIEVLAGRASVYPEAGLTLAASRSEPVPDIVVTSSPVVEHYRTAERELVVEISQSSLRYDVDVKAPLYAESGVPEYWVVNLVARELIVFRTPESGAYADRDTYQEGARVQPGAWPDVAIDVGQLFPDTELS